MKKYVKLYEEFILKMNENYNKYDKLVICDIQPAYGKLIDFMGNLSDFLAEFDGDILCLYNGEDFGMDTENMLTNYYAKHGLNINDEYSDGYSDDYDYIEDVDMRLVSMSPFEKNYGFIRDVMDEYGTDLTTKLVRFMIENDIHDLRNIDDSQQELLKNILIDYSELLELIESEDYTMSIPDGLIDLLKEYNNCYLIGGAYNECLAELRCVMDALDLNYEIIQEFVYD